MASIRFYLGSRETLVAKELSNDEVEHIADRLREDPEDYHWLEVTKRKGRDGIEIGRIRPKDVAAFVCYYDDDMWEEEDK